MLVLPTRAFNERTGIVIGLPMTHAAHHETKTFETNPFAVKFVGPKGETAYILTHQPKPFDWRKRAAQAPRWKRLPPNVLEEAGEGLNSILSLGS
jgi:mRNA interferase MazF